MENLKKKTNHIEKIEITGKGLGNNRKLIKKNVLDKAKRYHQYKADKSESNPIETERWN